MESVGNLVLYFVIVAIISVFSVMAVTSRKILRSATYLLFVLIGTAVVYFQLGYEFLGAVQIAVYAGGILVLFVFSILLTAQPNDKSEKLTSHRKFMGLAAAIGGVAVLLYALFTYPGFSCESLSNFMTAENAGMDCVLVSWGFRTEEELADCTPKAMIDRPEELLEVLEESSLG